MNEILLLVQSYLERANREAVGMSEEILDEAAAAFRASLDKTFNQSPKRDKFTIRMSNVGRPLCQLQMEQLGAEGEALSYDFRMKMIIGDLIDVIAVAIMKAAGVKIVSQQEKVSLPLEINGELISIDGSYDVEIEGASSGIYDVKSASNWAFRNKFDTGSFAGLKQADDFGYVSQGFGYAEGANKRFAGWIAVDKSTGEWAVLETPSRDDEYQKVRTEALDNIKRTVTALVTGAEFKRCFNAEIETYYRKPTGNTVLSKTCSFCPFKWKCWPELEYMQNPSSKSEGRFGYYVSVDPKHRAKGGQT